MELQDLFVEIGVIAALKVRDDQINGVNDQRVTLEVWLHGAWIN